MTTTIIIPTYKDLVALKLILEALETQTYNEFDVAIAEDNDSEEVINFLATYKSKLKIKHFSQADNGNRKAIILNKVLANIETDYVIFIDGDIIPYSTFIESHIILSDENIVLCGRRVNLGDKVSSDLRDGNIKAIDIEQSYFSKYRYLNNDNIRHYEQGIRFNKIFFDLKLVNKKDASVHILGSNFSCYRHNIQAINGFDENIIGCSKDDVDLEWRLRMSGCKFKSVQFFANAFHLNHSRNSRLEEEKLAKEQMKLNQDNKQFICINGIEKLNI